MTTDELTLQDLVTHSGMNLRTIRYYMQEGLLQGPDTRGKNAHYSQYHIDRLELIQRLKNLHLSLQEIRHLVNTMTPEEVSQITHYQGILNPVFAQRKTTESVQINDNIAGSSALEYIRNLQGARENIKSTTSSHPTTAPDLNIFKHTGEQKILINKKSNLAERGETWSRVVIESGIELHLREPMDPDSENKTKELINYARRLFGTKNRKGGL